MAYRIVNEDIPRETQRRRGAVRRRLRLRSVAVLPTLFTLGNLLCGFLAIFFASRAPDTRVLLGWTPLTLAALFVFLGMVLDAMDGRIARLTGQTSSLGEQLDSMADMVTFGVAPAFLTVQLVGIHLPFFSEARDRYFDRVVLVISGIYVACAALRLARFNIETKSNPPSDSLSFKGMPSPGAAGTVASFVLLHQHILAAHRHEAHWSIFAAELGMVALSLLVAVAMVSRLPYPHVANRYLRGKAKFNSVVKVVIVAPFLLIWPQATAAAAFAAYALSAPTIWLWQGPLLRSNKARREEVDEPAT